MDGIIAFQCLTVICVFMMFIAVQCCIFGFIDFSQILSYSTEILQRVER